MLKRQNNISRYVKHVYHTHLLLEWDKFPQITSQSDRGKQHNNLHKEAALIFIPLEYEQEIHVLKEIVAKHGGTHP